MGLERAIKKERAHFRLLICTVCTARKKVTQSGIYFFEKNDLLCSKGIFTKAKAIMVISGICTKLRSLECHQWTKKQACRMN